MTDFTDAEWKSPESDLDAAAFCSVCLIDENEEGKEKIKASCKLPIRSAPGQPVNKNALASASKLFNQTDASASAKDAAKARLKDLCAEAGVECNLSLDQHKLRFQFAEIRRDLSVDIIHAGVANGLTFTDEVLEKAVPLFADRPVFVDHDMGGFFAPTGRSVRDLAGHLSSPAWNAALHCITGRIK